MKKVLYVITMSLSLCSIGAMAQTKPHAKYRIDTTYLVVMKTSMGDITLKLYNETPKHRDNFVALVKKKFFDSLLFHRVIKDFMIQGGDPNSKTAQAGEMLGNGDVGYTIPAEFNPTLIHKKGALAAARNDNPQKASSGCQFYIVQGKLWDSASLKTIEMRTRNQYTPEQAKIYKTVGGTPFLDNNYTVYGETVAGLDIIDKIAAVSGDAMNRPFENVYILSTELKIETKKVKI